MDRTPSFAFERDQNDDHRSALKISAADWELNVWFDPGEAEKLKELLAAAWDDRRSIRAGTAGGAAVFWCLEEGRVVILVGEDDETWDISVSFDGLPALLAALGLSARPRSSGSPACSPL